jgi:ABC-type transporter Mla subunit MlaD
MSVQQQSSSTGRHTGRKIWYGVVIALSAAVILMSAAGILGTWAVGRALSDATVQLLVAVERAAGRAETLAGNVERGLADIQDLTTQVSNVTQQIGENVTDKGLVLTLLPEDRERMLVEKVQSVVDTLTAIRGAVNSAFEMYQAVDRLPFISLPKPATETVDKLEQAANDLQAMVNELAQSVRDFRAGVAGALNRVTTLADRIGTVLEQTRQNLTDAQLLLRALQQRSADLQQKVPIYFTILSVVLSLFFIFLLYTQVEVIRLFVGRWRGLNAPAALAAEASTAEALPPETTGEASSRVETQPTLPAADEKLDDEAPPE